MSASACALSQCRSRGSLPPTKTQLPVSTERFLNHLEKCMDALVNESVFLVGDFNMLDNVSTFVNMLRAFERFAQSVDSTALPMDR